uniref:Ataxin-1 n=1 Tax=Phallusia mammillata TaxID=59560 RepID=A0A6F9D809_9ASCI|nr:ataxin-1 [Phallusia mammillata]
MNDLPERQTADNQQQNGGLYPPHFEKGALIQLASGEIKCVQDLSIEDFQRSTDLSPDLKLDSSTVGKISLNQQRTMALLCFVVGEDKLQIIVEAPVEHPFFVYGKGWSAVTPEMSMSRYKLACHELIVGDVCASLTLKTPVNADAQNIADVPRDIAVHMQHNEINKPTQFLPSQLAPR